MRTLFDSSKSVNPNVPKDCFVIAEYSTMSGEIHHTYYANVDGQMFHVTDWSCDIPSPAFYSEIHKETGLWQRLIDAEYDAWMINKARTTARERITK
jgi:hypothetical protein